MPKYGKRKSSKRTNRRSSYRRRSYKSSKKTYKKNIKKALNSLSEKKFYTATTPNCTGAIATIDALDGTTTITGIIASLLTGIPQGATKNDRIGDKIYLRYLIISGEVVNRNGTAGISGMPNVWIFRETIPGSLASATRFDIIGANPYAQSITKDYITLGYKVMRKKHGYVYVQNGGAISNTPAFYNKASSSHIWRYYFKIKIFKTLTWTASGYKLSDGMGDYYPVLFFQTNSYNLVSTGPTSTSKFKVTYTDV